MLKAALLIVAFSLAFANAALDDQELWPLSENPSGLSGSVDVGELLNNEAAEGPDQNVFIDGSTSVGQYPKLEPELNAVELDNNNGLLAGLGSPSEPFNLLDPFGSDNKAGPPERLRPPNFPVPDCGPKVLLCCSGKPFGAGLYSKCDYCMLSIPFVQQEAEELQQINLTIRTDNENEPDCQIKYFLFCCEYLFVSLTSLSRKQSTSAGDVV